MWSLPKSMLNESITGVDAIRTVVGLALIIVAILIARRFVKRMLCNTGWARQQGYTVDTLKMDIFDRRG